MKSINFDGLFFTKRPVYIHSISLDQSSQLKQFLMQMKDLSHSKMNSNLAGSLRRHN